MDNLIYSSLPFQQVNGLVGSKLDVADEFMNDPSEVGSRGGKDDADGDSGDAASAPNAKKVRAPSNK